MFFFCTVWHTTCSYTPFFILTCSHRDFSFLLKLFTYSLTCSKEFEKEEKQNCSSLFAQYVLYKLFIYCNFSVWSIFCMQSQSFLFVFFKFNMYKWGWKEYKKNCSSLFVQYKLFLYCNISVWSYILPAVTVFFPFCFFKV